jgi:hypothetical protein
MDNCERHSERECARRAAAALLLKLCAAAHALLHICAVAQAGAPCPGQHCVMATECGARMQCAVQCMHAVSSACMQCAAHRHCFRLLPSSAAAVPPQRATAAAGSVPVAATKRVGAERVQLLLIRALHLTPASVPAECFCSVTARIVQQQRVASTTHHTLHQTHQTHAAPTSHCTATQRQHRFRGTAASAALWPLLLHSRCGQRPDACAAITGAWAAYCRTLSGGDCKLSCARTHCTECCGWGRQPVHRQDVQVWLECCG